MSGYSTVVVGDGLVDLFYETPCGSRLRIGVSVSPAEAQSIMNTLAERARILREGEDGTLFKTLTPREKAIWSAGYRHAERDYCVSDIPAVVELANGETLAGLSSDSEAYQSWKRLDKVVAAYNDEGTL